MAVFFLRVFLALMGLPLALKPTNMGFFLFLHSAEAYVLYLFSSILSISLQSMPKSLCGKKTDASQAKCFVSHIAFGLMYCRALVCNYPFERAAALDPKYRVQTNRVSQCDGLFVFLIVCLLIYLKHNDPNHTNIIATMLAKCIL